MGMNAEVYILAYSPPPSPVGGGLNQRVWRWGREKKGGKRERKFKGNTNFGSTKR